MEEPGWAHRMSWIDSSWLRLVTLLCVLATKSQGEYYWVMVGHFMDVLARHLVVELVERVSWSLFDIPFLFHTFLSAPVNE